MQQSNNLRNYFIRYVSFARQSTVSNYCINHKLLFTVLSMCAGETKKLRKNKIYDHNSVGPLHCEWNIPGHHNQLNPIKLFVKDFICCLGSAQHCGHTVRPQFGAWILQHHTTQTPNIALVLAQVNSVANCHMGWSIILFSLVAQFTAALYFLVFLPEWFVCLCLNSDQFYMECCIPLLIFAFIFCVWCEHWRIDK